MDPLRGEYGFLTMFTDITEAEAIRHVDQMWNLSIREFEFYNAHGGYSKPPDLSNKTWQLPKPFQDTVVEMELVLAYTRYIAQKGGRSWLHVQMQATDVGDEDLQQGMMRLPPYKVGNRPLLDLVVPNRTWGELISERWANFSSSLGFQGIHWSTFGNWGDAGEKGADYPGFLEASLPVLQEYGLGQTCGFIDGFGYEESLFQKPVVAFNYWVRWEKPALPLSYWETDAAKNPGVYCSWPGHSAQHTNEHWNKNHVGITAFDLIKSWWRKARDMNSTFLAIGDGNRHLQDDYYPNSVPLNDEQIRILEEEVLGYHSTITSTLGPSTTTTARTGKCELKTKSAIMHVAPGTNAMMARLREKESELEASLKAEFDACRVSVIDYEICPDEKAVCVRLELQEFEEEEIRRLADGQAPLLARGKDPQSLPEAALRREKMVLQPSDGQRSRSADMTEEVNEAIDPMQCTKAIAVVYDDREDPEPVPPNGIPPFAIWATAISLWMACCFFCIFLLLICPRADPKPSDPPFCNSFDSSTQPLTRPSGDEDFSYDNIPHMMNGPGSARGPTFTAAAGKGGSTGLR